MQAALENGCRLGRGFGLLLALEPPRQRVGQGVASKHKVSMIQDNATAGSEQVEMDQGAGGEEHLTRIQVWRRVIGAAGTTNSLNILYIILTQFVTSK